MERSGTNFLKSLLCIHPDCVSGDIVHEDYLTAHSNLILRYVESVHRNWNLNWKVAEHLGGTEALFKCIGDGLISFLQLQTTKKGINKSSNSEHDVGAYSATGIKRLVTKTPSVDNIHYFFKLFPDAHLLILLRDGRAVVESGVKSFGWVFEIAMRKWAKAARNVLEFDYAAKSSGYKYLVIRYEDVYSKPEKELKRIFDFIGLEVEKYEFNAAMNLSIKGSSVIRKNGKEAVHWDTVKKTAQFSPLERWAYWRRSKHERFNWIAGQYLERCGYKEQNFLDKQCLWKCWNILSDILWGPVILAWKAKTFFQRKHDEWVSTKR